VASSPPDAEGDLYQDAGDLLDRAASSVACGLEVEEELTTVKVVTAVAALAAEAFDEQRVEVTQVVSREIGGCALGHRM
jgi:hypothetical protein